MSCSSTNDRVPNLNRVIIGGFATNMRCRTDLHPFCHKRRCNCQRSASCCEASGWKIALDAGKKQKHAACQSRDIGDAARHNSISLQEISTLHKSPEKSIQDQNMEEPKTSLTKSATPISIQKRFRSQNSLATRPDEEQR